MRGQFPAWWMVCKMIKITKNKVIIHKKHRDSDLICVCICLYVRPEAWPEEGVVLLLQEK